MNFCRRCQSDYDRPGTCNCYAESAAPASPSVQPVFVPRFVPYWHYPVQPWNPISPTIAPLPLRYEITCGATSATTASIRFGPASMSIH